MSDVEHEQIHGEMSCTDYRRFFCVVCWRHVCWCKGCADGIDELIAASAATVPTGDPGICDDCSATLGARGQLEGIATI